MISYITYLDGENFKEYWVYNKTQKSGVGIGAKNRNEYNSRVEYNGRDEFGGNEIDGSKFKDNKVAKKKNHQKISKSKKIVRSSDFLTFGARLVFIKLK